MVLSDQQARRLQRAANGVLGRRNFPWRKVKVNGDLDRRSLDAIHMAAWLMGFSEAQLARVRRGQITPHLFQIMTRQRRRPPALKKRDQQRREEAAKLRRRYRRRGTLANVKIHSTAAGAPHYGGAAHIMGQIVAPLLVGKYGYPLGSGKRTPKRNREVGGSPTSDHLTTHTLTFARDFPTFDGEAAARALARLFGWKNWQPNTWTSHVFRVLGSTFRIQILWGSGIGHGDHIHVGISLLA